jgi:aspartate racemase
VTVAAENAVGEKRLVAYVVPADPHRSPAIAELRDFLKQKLPGYMMPGAFVILPNLPVTPNGKIDRRALPEPDRSPARLGPRPESVDPITVVELQLTQIWKRILGVPAVGVRDNFFDIGGHSLLVVQVISEIHKVFHRSLPIAVFFQNPTIEGMAQALREDDHTQGEPELIPLAAGRRPGTLFFVVTGIEVDGIGLCRFAQLLNDGPASFATIVPLTSTLNRAAATGRMSELPSVEELAAKHAALIRSQQPCGPCLLAGHSFGGLLAFEVAHQLQREGRQVDAILLLDSWATLPPWWQKLKTLPLESALHALKVRARALRLRVRGGTANKVRRIEARESLLAAESGLEDGNQPFGAVPWHVAQRFRCQSYKNYRRHQLDSRAVLFRVQDPAMARLHAIRGNLGWGGLFARGLEIVEVPGDHLSILKAPDALALAQRFQECLEHIELRAENGDGDRLVRVSRQPDIV